MNRDRRRALKILFGLGAVASSGTFLNLAASCSETPTLLRRKGVQPILSDDKKFEIFVFDKPGHQTMLEAGSAEIKAGDNVEIIFNFGLYHGADKGYRPVGGYINHGQIAQAFVEPGTQGGNFEADTTIFGQRVNGDFFMLTPDEARAEWKVAGARGLRDIANIEFAFQNGRPLLINGAIPDTYPANSQNRTQRQGIGYIPGTNGQPDKLVFITSTSNEVNYHEIAKAFQDIGAQNAIYLDGTVTGYIDDLQPAPGGGWEPAFAGNGSWQNDPRIKRLRIGFRPH